LRSSTEMLAARSGSARPVWACTAKPGANAGLRQVIHRRRRSSVQQTGRRAPTTTRGPG
jgi:hypothetical protein